MAKGVEEALSDIYSLIDKGEFNEAMERMLHRNREFPKDIYYQIGRIGALTEIYKGLGAEGGAGSPMPLLTEPADKRGTTYIFLC